MRKYWMLSAVLLCVSLAACAGAKEPPAAGTDTEVSREVTAATAAAATAAGDEVTVVDTVAETAHEPAESEKPTESEAPDESEAPIETEEETVVTYRSLLNPIVPVANDPWVAEHEGRYYYCRALNYLAGGVIISEVPSPYQLDAGEDHIVYVGPADTGYSAEYWAPELHYINGIWYIYVAADDGRNENHRMYVLRGTTQDPTDPFEMVGQITDPSNKWAIDGSVLTVGGELYFIWSGWKYDRNEVQCIYIAHMSDPCTVDSERVQISAPTRKWEKVGTPLVNEGPTALYHGEDTYIVYSASGSWTDSYCLGLLTLTGDDPMDPAAWTKSTEPVFASREKLAYGPGHCCFVKAVDGSTWMLCHANQTSGTGWQGRSGWISPVTFAEDGTPLFGEPRRTVRFPIEVHTKP